MTLRFRNRFTGSPSNVRRCDCGGRVSFSTAGARESIIHELPWCNKFETLMRAIEGEADVSAHLAVVGVPEGEPVVVVEGETVIIADGESVDDVNVKVGGS